MQFPVKRNYMLALFVKLDSSEHIVLVIEIIFVDVVTAFCDTFSAHQHSLHVDWTTEMHSSISYYFHNFLSKKSNFRMYSMAAIAPMICLLAKFSHVTIIYIHTADEFERNQFYILSTLSTDVPFACVFVCCECTYFTQHTHNSLRLFVCLQLNLPKHKKREIMCTRAVESRNQ